MMESWDYQTPSPDIKFENSPAESFLSAPGESYPSLFGSSAATTMDPHEMMTPQSTADDKHSELSSALSGLASNLPESPMTPGSSTSEKKQAKKRKSWGQVLPEPKTNLPPRKRAKTEDEKEQRRVERVLRNRRAAQSSRERKRLEVEALEIRNQALEAELRKAKQANDALLQKLHQFQSTSGVMPRASPPFDGLRANPVTFSQELFGSQDGHSISLEHGDQSIEDILLSSQSNSTVNPASLSPALSPIPDEDEEDEEDEEDDEDDEPAMTIGKAMNAATTTENASPDATQHPAEMLCEDLQCRSAEASRSWLTASQQQLHPALALLLPLQLLLQSTSAMLSLCQRPLMQIAMSMKAGFSLPPTASILTTIIILVTTPRSHSRQQTSSTSTNSSTTTSTSSPPLSTSSSNSSSSTPMTAQPPTPRSSTLRLSTLRKILSCSPTLARPLMDATMAVLRLASSERHEVDRVQGGDASAAAAADGSPQQQKQQHDDSKESTWPVGVPVPSRERLLTLLWAIRVEERRIQIRDRITAAEKEPGRPSVSETMTQTNHQKYVLLKVGSKRAREADHYRYQGRTSLKRRSL